MEELAREILEYVMHTPHNTNPTVLYEKLTLLGGEVYKYLNFDIETSSGQLLLTYPNYTEFSRLNFSLDENGDLIYTLKE